MNRICMYTPSATGGHALYTRELMTALSSAGGGRFAFELVSSVDLDEQFKSTDYDVHPILPPLAERSQFSNRAAWAVNRVSHYFRRELTLLSWLKTRRDIDAVHFQEWTPWLAKPLFRRLHAIGKKVFYTVHNIVPHRYPARVPKSVMHGWIRGACREADALFVHTELLASELSKFLGASHPVISVTPHGVWTVPANIATRPLRDRLNEKKLLFFGTIRRNKGVDLLLRAAADHLPGYRVTIAGLPLDREYFTKQVLPLVAHARGKGVRVELIDRFLEEEEVGPLFARHGALVMPYTPDFAAQSGVAFMALAHELPVIASEVGGLRDLFGQYRIGTTFRDFTPESLAAAVHALHAGATAGELIDQMRAAKEDHSWDVAARETIRGYAAAMGTNVCERHEHRVATTSAC